jgi:hypothetical protein
LAPKISYASLDRDTLARVRGSVKSGAGFREPVDTGQRRVAASVFAPGQMLRPVLRCGSALI